MRIGGNVRRRDDEEDDRGRFAGRVTDYCVKEDGDKGA